MFRLCSTRLKTSPWILLQRKSEEREPCFHPEKCPRQMKTHFGGELASVLCMHGCLNSFCPCWRVYPASFQKKLSWPFQCHYSWLPQNLHLYFNTISFFWEQLTLSLAPSMSTWFHHTFVRGSVHGFYWQGELDLRYICQDGDFSLKGCSGHYILLWTEPSHSTILPRQKCYWSWIPWRHYRWS